jgi:hypothetical protein
MRSLFLAALFVSSVWAQTSQPPATADEVKYLRFLLLNVASLEHSQVAVKAFEELLVKQFGLNTQESATIHSHGQTLNSLLAQHRQQRGAIIAGNTKPLNADLAALAQLDAEREQTVVDLANQLLSSVRAQTAIRLRNAGHIVASAAKKN